MFESFFIFDQKYYKQCDDVAMGSPFRPMLINVLMCHFELVLTCSNLLCTEDISMTHLTFLFSSTYRKIKKAS